MSPQSRTPLLEWIAGALGLAIVVAVLGYLGYHAIAREREVPQLSVAVQQIVPAAGGYVVRIAVRNRSSATAADVQVQGTLSEHGRELRKSFATVDFVPGDSQRPAGLLFDLDPSKYEISVRALGYQEP